MSGVAIVVGGSDQVWNEVEQARVLCAAAEQAATFYVCNDMIAVFPESAVGVTLQCHKLDKWLSRRTLDKHPPLTELWAHKNHVLATNSAVDEGGSVGLFAARIATIQRHHNRVLLCGVPMTKAGNHFVRQRPWDACELFRGRWIKLIPVLKETTRSFSGWTSDLLGLPDVTWINSAPQFFSALKTSSVSG